MLFVAIPARLFESSVIANFVFHAPLDRFMAAETFFIREIPGIIVTFDADIRNFASLVGLGKLIRRDHDVEFLRYGYLLGQQVALGSHSDHEPGGYNDPYPPHHRLMFLDGFRSVEGFCDLIEFQGKSMVMFHVFPGHPSMKNSP